jgi:VWFA-related protein
MISCGMKPQLLFIALSILVLAVYSQGQQTTLPADAPTVKVRFSVIDASGRAVDNLKPEDLQVFDEGSPINVEWLAKEKGPLLYGLLIDRSGSLKLHFSNIKDIAAQVIAANEVNDQTFLVSFVDSDKMEMVQELTSDTATLLTALGPLRVEGGQTALHDAVYLSAQYAMKHPPPSNYRMALVLLSDCEERTSFYSEQQLMELLGKTRIQIFVVALVGDLEDNNGFIKQSQRQKASDFATRLARATGGDAFILRSPKELAAVATQLTTELHNQYVLGYKPTKKTDKQNRKVEIKLTKSPEHQNWRLVVGNVITEPTK